MNGTNGTDSEDDLKDWYAMFSFWLEGFMVPIISIPGIIGNIACVFVFNHKSVDLKQSFSNILKCLSIFDIIFLVGVTCLYSLPELSSFYRTMIGPVLTPVILPITQMALTGSVYSVVAVAVERYFNICKPFDRNRVGVMDGFGYILGIVVFSFSYNIIKFFELKTVYNTSYDNTTNISTTQPNVELTSLRKNPVYVNTYIVCNTIIMGVFPLFLLWLLNWRIIAAMQLATRRHNNISSLQRRDRAMTALLSGVVLVLIICHAPKTIINIYESYQMMVYGKLKFTPFWGKIVIKLSHLLLASSSALNIVIYSYKDFKFRAIVTSLCRKPSGSKKFTEVNGGESQMMTVITSLDGGAENSRIPSHLGCTGEQELISSRNTGEQRRLAAVQEEGEQSNCKTLTTSL